MNERHPASKIFSAALAAALAVGPTPLWAQMNARAVSAPAVTAVPGAAGAASLAAPAANVGLTPTLAAPGSVLPTPSLSGLSIVAANVPVAAAPAAAAALSGSIAGPAAQAAVGPAAAAVETVTVAGKPVPNAFINGTSPYNKPPAKGLSAVLGAITKSLSFGRTSAMFTGGAVGFRPEEAAPQDRDGVRLDPKPSLPQQTESPGLSWDKVQLPGVQPRRTLLQRFGITASPAGPVALPGNPTDAAGVESALRRLIQATPSEYGGVASAQLATVIAHRVAGQSGLADTIYVNFKQLHNGVTVDGTFLGFTVKIIDGKAVVIGSSANLFPWLDVDTFGRFDDRAILERAATRLGHTTASPDDFNDQGVKLMHLEGQWRAVRLMMSKAKTLVAAVDINTGQTFAWDARHSLNVSGNVSGRAIADGPIESGVPSPMAVGHVEIVASNGRKYFADYEGRFTVEGEGDAPVKLTVKLSGRYAAVSDQERKDLVVTVTAKPGEELRVVFNPAGKDENALAQMNAYIHTTAVHEFLTKHGISLTTLDKPMPVKVNIDDECNAYYTPYSPSLNFFKSSARCANSSYNDVAQHEYGHALDDAAHGGIKNGGLSEAIGDMLAMMLTGQPIIGRGFLKGGNPDYIRTGENKYQYRSRDEVHAQGQAGGGFVWKLRKSFVAALGEVEGVALTNALILPAILASNRDIPAFINSVLLRDIGADGVAPHYQQIAAAAAAHGIKVAEPKPGQIAPTGGYVQAENWWSPIISGLWSAWQTAAQVMSGPRNAPADDKPASGRWDI
ncbi:MAG: hypothetical protein HYZ75_14425 [Elusimicrobia bacterium]|nr:hypothetical protein [Elusimicrobiota bacterium]